MRNISRILCAVLVLLTVGFTALNKSQPAFADVEISLPAGFKAETVVQSSGSNRHLVVNNNGDVYVKLSRLKDGKGILVLRKKNGKYELINSFGNYTGTGIAIKNGYLYASSDNEVFRYKFNANNDIADPNNPEKIITGLVSKGQHASKSIALDNAGNIYVNIGAPSNACQVTATSFHNFFRNYTAMKKMQNCLPKNFSG